MAKSRWKLPFIPHFPEKWENQKQPIMWTRRGAPVVPSFFGKTVFIHNGQRFISRDVTRGMIGERFGAFALTRKRHQFKKKGV